MLLIAIGLLLVIFSLFGNENQVISRTSFGIGIVAFGFGLLAYIR